MKRIQIIVYVLYKDSKSSVLKFEKLEQAHREYNEIIKVDNYKYVELGLDMIDINGKYKILRKQYDKNIKINGRDK